MITYIDLAPMAHISILLKVPVPLPAGGWTWGQSTAHPGELGRDYGYSDAEARSLVHSYGRWVPEVLGNKVLGERFRICAWGVTTRMCVGMQEWAWSAEAREFKRAGEYLSAWKEAIRAYYMRTGEIFEDKRFSARSGMALHRELERQPVRTINASVSNMPHVRHKEDVPHEAALPNLWGLPKSA